MTTEHTDSHTFVGFGRARKCTQCGVSETSRTSETKLAMTQRCEIKWIDCKGNPTPDNNEAVGLAIYRRTGPNSHDVVPYHVCAEHAKWIGGVYSHYDPTCKHMKTTPTEEFSRFGSSSTWTFEPYPT